MIPDETIAEIRARVDIVQVISQHVQLRKAGRSWKGLCPFHGEKTPSFNVSPDKGFFYCFGCQKKGDAFTFVMEYEGKSFHEAAEALAALAGVAIPVVEEDPAQKRARSERAQMLEVNKLATAFFRDMLKQPRGAAGRAYLDKRKIGAEAETQFQLGYAPADWHALADHLRDKRVDMEVAVKLGLVARQPSRGGFYDRFRDRLVCPVIVPGGEVVGFSARIVGDSQPDAPKYFNSPESTVYKKSKLLFGLAQARDAMRTKHRAVLVEGNFDVISMHQAGFAETIAPLGTALTAEQVDQMRRLADKVVLFYDGDRAGYRATHAALELCFAAELPALIARKPGRAGGGGAGVLSDGADPDTVVHAGGSEALAEMLDRAQPGMEFMAYEVWSMAKDDVQKGRAIEDAAKLLAKVANTTTREVLIAGTLASAMKLDPGVVQRALARALQGGHATPVGDRAPADIEKPPSSEELDLVCLLADHPSLLASAREHGVLSLLTDARLRDMYSATLESGRPLVELASEQPRFIAQHILAGRFAQHPDPAHQLARMVAAFRTRKADLHLKDLERRLAEARRSGDRDLERSLANEIVLTRKQVD